MGRIRSGWVGVLVAVVVGLGWARAADAGNLDEAKAAFAAGKAAYERGDYDAALVQFQRANLIQPAPSLSFNIGMTYERVGRNRDAVAAFERYLTLTGTPQNPQEQQFQDNLKTRIASLRSRSDVAPGVRQPPPQQEIQPPPPQNPQYNYYYQQQPQPGQPYYYPQQQPQFVYQVPVLSPQQRIENAKKKRGSGIGLLVSGLVLDVVGIAMIGIEVASGGRYYWLVGGFGVVFTLTGVVLWPIGIATMVKAGKELDEATRQTPVQPQVLAIPEGLRQASLEPATFLFHLPAVRF